MFRKAILLIGSVAALFLVIAQSGAPQQRTFEDLQRLPVPPGAQRFSYGTDPFQFGELRVPPGPGPFPVVVVIHGGCWYSQYDLSYLANFNSALTRLGVATWSLEYRRIGNSGGGWPGTFVDVARGTDHLRVLAQSHPLDLDRVIVVGHSAGGQLALWLATRDRLPKESPLFAVNPLPLRGVVALAGITDLQRYRPNCGGAVTRLLGGSPAEFPERYRQLSPIELLPIKIEQRLIQGGLDEIVPPDFSRDYAAAAKQSGDPVQLTLVPDAGHFDLVALDSSVWPVVENAIKSLLALKKQ